MIERLCSIAESQVDQRDRIGGNETIVSRFEFRKRRPSLVYCGDDAKAKKTVARLIRELGFDAVDAGALEMARHAEPFTLLVAKLAYEGDAGPALAYRFEPYEERS